MYNNIQRVSVSAVHIVHNVCVYIYSVLALGDAIFYYTFLIVLKFDYVVKILILVCPYYIICPMPKNFPLTDSLYAA